jgi:hypothetical protein
MDLAAAHCLHLKGIMRNPANLLEWKDDGSTHAPSPMRAPKFIDLSSRLTKSILYFAEEMQAHVL